MGAGVGALTFELLERGVRRAVVVEASAGYAVAGFELIAQKRTLVWSADVFTRRARAMASQMAELSPRLSPKDLECLARAPRNVAGRPEEGGGGWTRSGRCRTAFG